MGQVLDYPSISGKRWEWHLVLFKEWLRTVEAGISDRKLTKWLRGRKVFDRGFIGFSERFLGMDHPPKQPPTLNEVGKELLEELAKSEELAQSRAALQQQGSGVRIPRSRGMALPPAPGQQQTHDGEEEEEYKPPSAENDPFLRALLERFCELNGYLSMFVYKEITDQFLSPTEMFRRIGSNDFAGARPSMLQFDDWAKWMEWLGGVRKVGFRHKFTEAGAEVGRFLMEMPVEELLEEDEEEEEVAADVVADVADDVADEASAEDDAQDPSDEAGGFEGGDLPDEFEDDELDEEGLDLPPSVDLGGVPAADRYWEKDEPQDPAAEPPGPPGRDSRLEGESASTAEAEQHGATLEVPTRERSERARGEQRRSEPASEGAATSSALSRQPASEPPSAARVPAREAPSSATSASVPESSSPRPSASPSPSPRPVSALNHKQALQLVAQWWLSRPAEERPLSQSGVSLRPHPTGQPVALFKLLTLASLLEADGPSSEAVTLFQSLDTSGALEAFLVEDAPLDRVLQVAWDQGASSRLEERLVHVLRYRRGLMNLGPLPDNAQAAAQCLREKVTGDTLGAGLIFVLRELALGGGGPSEGLDALGWLPSLLD